MANVSGKLVWFSMNAREKGTKIRYEKKKMVPPKSIAVKEKERNEIYIYIY